MYVDLAGLARYKRDFDAWARGALLPKDAAAARVRTAKAGAVSFVPVQETPLDVSVDFLFAETPPALGDKGPENPSTITGVTQAKVTRCGKNLLDVNATVATGNLSAAVNIDGSIHISGTTEALNYVYFSQGNNPSNKKLPNYIQKGKTYTFSLTTSFENCSFGVYISNSLSSWSSQNTVSPNSSVTVTVGSDAIRAMFRLQVPSGYTTNFDAYIQIEEGDTATSFEKAVTTDYTIPLGATYYGGTLDVATGAMMVTHICDTFTRCSGSWFYGGFTQTAETLSFQVGGSRAHLVTGGTLVSNMFIPGNSDTGVNKIAIRGSETSNVFKCSMVKSALDLSGVVDPDVLTQEEAVAVVNAFLSQNPLKVVYNPITPETVQLTPTEILSLTQSSVYDPRVNTVYGDAQAVQVGYLKHPSAASADLRSALVSLGGGV